MRVMCVSRTNPDGSCPTCDGSGYVEVSELPTCATGPNKVNAVGARCETCVPPLQLNPLAE